MPSQLSIFGIRHHGPGSARSLQRALGALKPDCVLIEGPPEADDLLPLAKNPGFKPPVALLVYAAEDSKQAAFYPFATFSPEWQAIQYAVHGGIPVRFMDLPLTNRFAMNQDKSSAVLKDHPPPASEVPDVNHPPEPADDDHGDVNEDEPNQDPFVDPLSHLAQAAGYPDAETWWDRMIESRSGTDAADLFAAILEAMTALRHSLPARPDPFEPLREAHMRKIIRATMKEGHQKIAVVCGAWHAPVLLEATMPPVKQDSETLKDLPKLRAAAAWVPWTYSRLSAASGYGAGITSPGFYHHLWTHTGSAKSQTSPNDSLAISWLTKVARLLRQEDLDTSSAHIIEAVRLAETLAAMRQYPAPSLLELNEAARTVLLFGDSAPLALIHQKLVVSDRLGEIPSEVPLAPLQLDLQLQQKRLRLPPDPAQKPLELDLRKPNDLGRSELLHRLGLLGIGWGLLKSSGNVGGAKGTFKELWQIQWEPEFAVKLIEASVLGNSVYDAASASARRTAALAKELPIVTALVDQTLQANLSETVAFLLKRLDALAAVASDLLHMMNALPPLANVVRYGNVRKADTTLILKVVSALLARITIGLPPACASLNDEAAAQMEAALSGTHAAVQLLYSPNNSESKSRIDDWLTSLTKLADQTGLHGVLGGRVTRLLLEAGQFAPEDAARRMSLALSTGIDPAHAAAWIEGFLKGSGLILLHDENLWSILDQWVTQLSDDQFTGILPLVRRSFSQFSMPERHQIGQKLKSRSKGSGAKSGAGREDQMVDEARAAKVLPILARILAPLEANP